MNNDNYEKYINQQSSKLNTNLTKIRNIDNRNEQVVYNRYKNMFDFNGDFHEIYTRYRSDKKNNSKLFHNSK